jgi:peptidyl-prolyl cis-trans isomerase B (cyclophilin B)
MMFTALLLAVLPCGISAESGGQPEVKWHAPSSFLAGGSFRVQVEIKAPAGGAEVPNWLLSPAAFSADGDALDKRPNGDTIRLPEGFTITGELDLGPLLKSPSDFKLAYAKEFSNAAPLEVKLLKPAPAGLKFMDPAAIPDAALANYNVLLQTSRGDMQLEFWPDVAPNHVRNFLDLASTGYYDGVIFHRVFPGFMIQGGNAATKRDPNATAEEPGPRTLKAEFSAKRHERGVLSAARSPDPDSASSQFFIMHANATHLDGQYSAFGKLVTGYDVLDLIANSPGRPIPGAGGVRPNEPQKILRAIVVEARPSK